MKNTTYYWLALSVAIATVLFLLFGIGALGIVGSGGRDDLWFGIALAIGLIGAVVARFRARGMALAMAATALATLLIGIGAVAAGLQDDGSAFDVVMVSTMYAALFGASAWLFTRADQGSQPLH